MYIVENKRIKVGAIYCVASECIWNPAIKRYSTPGKTIGSIKNSVFTPNEYLSTLIRKEMKDPNNLSSYEKLIVATALEKYGNNFLQNLAPTKDSNSYKTARVEFTGPSLVFGAITKNYKIDKKLNESFGEDIASQILALSWFITSEGSALSNNDYWLDQFENPIGCSLSSQEVSKLLDDITFDDMMTFYQLWLADMQNKHGKILYDLTSISYYGSKNNLASWGYNRDNEDLPQVNFGLICTRDTGMPLFSWLMDGSISDVSTLIPTLQYLEKLNYKPDCILMDRAFSTKDNITYMLKHKQKFLQALKNNAIWIKKIIDTDRLERALPTARIKVDERKYYVSTTPCKWISITKTNKNGEQSNDVIVIPKREPLIIDDNKIKISGEYSCYVHVLFCQDLVGNQKERLTDEIENEYNRLIEQKSEVPKKGLEKYFNITKNKNKLTIKYNAANIDKEKFEYAGHVCYLTNDKTIDTAEKALSEYSTRDYIEKDFDEMKNELDMKRIHVHTEKRMHARLFIQFISEIYMREIRVRLGKHKLCKKLTRDQIFGAIKSIYKIKFKGKRKDIMPTLSKTQISILEAIEVSYK